MSEKKKTFLKEPMKPPRLSKMDPMDDIKKMGEILMKRTSEKEFYRFLHVQEQCQIKWQISIDKYNKLKMEHANCKSIRAEWEAKFQHVTELLLNEKQKRRNAEARRDFLANKLEQTYDFLRGKNRVENINDGESNELAEIDVHANDEITSTGSFLSNLSDLSITDDDIIDISSLQLNVNSNTQINQMTIDQNWLENTIPVSYNRNSINNRCVNNTEIELGCDSKVLGPKKRPKMYLHVDENFTNGKLCDEHSKPSVEIDELISNESHIYAQIGDNDCLFEHDDKENIVKNGNGNVKEEIVIDIPVSKVNSKSEVAINPNNCHHSFSHRSALRSEVCFHCSKKFRFGILAFRCTICRVYAHHDCKAQLKMALKHRQLDISDYVTETGPSVPALIVHCVNEVETRGLSERGIYRVSGSEKEIKALKDRFLCDDYVPNLDKFDMHVICGCIKIFLRSLREPLIPTSKWESFSNAVSHFDDDHLDGNNLRRLQHEIGQLPRANRDTLAFLVLHLQRVATCDEVKMPIPNLAKIFGPTIIGYSKSETDQEEILRDTFIQQNVMEHFLNISTDYWFQFISENSNY